MRRPSKIGMIFCGLILSGLPLLAVARHSHVENNQVNFSVPATISSRADSTQVSIWSDINVLNLSNLSGSDRIRRGETIYVSLAQGPNNIAYPFAVTHDKARTSIIDTAFTIKGTVTEVDNNRLIIRYSFESFIPVGDLAKRLNQHPIIDATLDLSVNNQSVPRMTSITIDDEIYAQRVMDAPLLKGFIQ